MKELLRRRINLTKLALFVTQMIGIPAIKMNNSMNNSNEMSALESIKIENISEAESYPESKYLSIFKKPKSQRRMFFWLQFLFQKFQAQLVQILQEQSYEIFAYYLG